MLFNSFEFFIFFPIVTITFFLLPHKFRWFLLLAASSYFYMAFVPIYILVLFSIIIVDYFGGIFIENTTGKKRKWYFVSAIIVNIVVLCVFKYYNFFIGNANLIIIKTFDYREFPFPYLNLLLPLGLSFHTFQAISYIIEVNRNNIKAERHFGIYALYVMFYPQLVAGPIERPQNLLHQFHQRKYLDGDRILIGLKIMLWGFAKKLVIADRLALYVTEVHNHAENVGTVHLWIASFIFFPFQVYCDFSGYSSIALGAAKVMGFNLMENFKTPFYSLTTSELWNRWHISLSTWFRDYIYQPLVIFFRDQGKRAVVLGLVITFFLSGLWHGAGWTFIVYGLVQGIVMVAEYLFGIKTTKLSKTRFGTLKGIIITYFLFAFSLIFFRAQGMNRALFFIKKMFWDINIDFTSLNAVAPITLVLSFIFIIALLYFEKNYSARLVYKTLDRKKEILFTSTVILLIILFGVFHNISFIYFQF